MISPIETVFDAVYFDGQTAVRRPARVTADGEGLLVEVEGDPARHWPHSDSHLASDGVYGDPIRIERGMEAIAVANGRFLDCLRQLAPRWYAPSRVDTFYSRSWASVLLSTLIIAVVAGATYFWGIRLLADGLARVAPRSMEERLGRSAVAILAPPPSLCTDRAAMEPLERLTARLSAAAQTKYRIRVLCSNNPMVNAFAAPGGTIVVFRGLLEEIESPDELAGVLAHEIQHVTHRHATRALMRETSARALLALLSVDPSGSPQTMQGFVTLANLNYQRSDEEEADREAVALLRRARIRPDALAMFFRRLQKYPGTSLGKWTYLSTHPDLAQRIDDVEAAVGTVRASTAPALTGDEWQRVRNGCR
jgi:beta-barrel assembly-enhancing protease